MKLSSFAVCMGLSLAAFTAQAQTLVFSKSLDLDLDTGAVASLNFSQVGADTVVTLNADWSSDLLGNNVFLSRLFFNYDGATTLTPTAFNDAAGVKDFEHWERPHTNAGYEFNYALELSTRNRGGERLLDGESLSWTFANANASDFGGLALVHLQGLNGGGSVKIITAPVPEPETYALIGMGLLGVAAARRRKKSA